MRNYWIYFFSSLVSLVGSNFFLFTQGFYLLELTGEKTSVGLTWSLFFLPSLICLPVIGKLLDGFDLKRVLMGVEWIKFILFVVFIPLMKVWPQALWVYLLAVLYGLVFAPYYPSVYVVVKRLVPVERQTRYSHLSEVSLQVANIAAVFSSGMIYEVLGFLNLLWLSALCLGLGMLGLRSLKMEPMASTQSGRTLWQAYRDIARLAMGWRRSGLSRRQLLFGICHQFPQAVTLVGNVPMILYVSQSMQRGPKEFGWLDSLFGVAALGASLAWARWQRVSERPSLLPQLAAASGLAIVIMALLPPMGLWPYAWMLIYGGLLISSKILCRAAVVRLIPAGSVGTYSTFFQTSGYVLMMALFGVVSWTSDFLGAPGMFFLLGVLMLLFSWLLAYCVQDWDNRRHAGAH